MEPLTQTTIVKVEDPSQIAVARRTASEFAKAARLDEVRSSAVCIVAVELANNLLQHAGRGELFFQFYEAAGTLDIAAVDHGKGMRSVERCLEDGFSTASTPGLGLGAVKRFAVEFAAFSVPDRTTVVAARMAQTPASRNLSMISTAVDGEVLSGDSWAVSDDGCTLFVVDGLGHGLFAADAARAATAIFQKYQNDSPQELLNRMHLAMRSTRGAAGAIARIHPEERALDFAGIGNISCSIVNRERSQSTVSHNGTLGHQMRRVQQFRYNYLPGDLLLMQSDGLLTNSKGGIPAGLLLQPPFLVAPFLYSEQLRGRDDATILVCRLG